MENLERKYLARFRQGSEPIGMNAIDYFHDGKRIIRRYWGMGGEDMKPVKHAP